MEMSEELRWVEQRVTALARRERSLLAWGALSRGLAVLGATLGASVCLAQLSVERATAAGLLVLVSGVVSWLLVGRPLALAWRRAADPLRQARFVEAREPRLAGGFVTSAYYAVVDRASAPSLAGFVARTARALAEAHAPEVVHPATSVKRWGAGAGAVWLLALLVMLLTPGGAEATWRWWLGDISAPAAIATTAVEATGTPARVGDLVLRYVYPDYTGLEPVEVVNSTGEAHAVPGTRVEVVARSGGTLDQASIVAYEQPATDATVTDGRTIRGSFVIGADKGFWKILTHVGGVTEASRSFPIVPEADLAPEVTAVVPDEGAEVIEWPFDRPLPVDVSASDDFGLTRVMFEVDGREAGVPIARPDRRVRDLAERAARTPSDLGMKEGGTYSLVVAAWDNDTVSGSKAGRSAPLRILVLGGDGVARLDAERRRELLQVMVVALADFLEESTPVGTSAADYARWGERVNGRYEPIAAFLGNWSSRTRPPREVVPVIAALSDGLTLVRFTQVSFVAESDAPVNAASAQSVAAFRAGAVESLEAAILHVDALINAAALRALTERSGVLVDAADLLAARAAQDSVAPGDLLLQTEGLVAFLESMKEPLVGVRDEAMETLVLDRVSEIERISASASGALRDGDRALARQLTTRIADRTRQLADAIRQEVERRKQASKEGQDSGRGAIQALREVATQQRDLAATVAAAREKGSAAWREAVRALWEKVETLSRGLATRMTRYGEAATAAGRRFNEVALVEDAADQAEGAAAAADMRDFEGVWSQATSAQYAWARYVSRAQMFARAAPLPRQLESELSGIEADAARLTELLHELRARGEQGDPAVQSAVRGVSPAEQALGGAMVEAAAKARTAAQRMTVTPRDLEPALQGAIRRIESAAQQLAQGDALQGHGSQEAAIRHIEDAIAALEQAAAAAQQQQQEMQSGGQGQGSAGAGGDEREPGAEAGPEDDQKPAGPTHFELPEPEEFRTPEAYRDALLRGMEADVPEEYRVLKRRYYEELVNP